MQTAQPQSAAEIELLSVMVQIYFEVMDHPPFKPESSDSYLPPSIIDDIKAVLAVYGAPTAKAQGVKA